MTQHINLYHAEFRPPKNPLPARYILAAAGATALVTMLLYGFDRWQLSLRQDNLTALEKRAEHLEAQVEQLSGQIAGRHQDPALVDELASLEGRLRSLNEAEQALKTGTLGSPTGYSAYFAALGRVRVPEVWLSGIVLQGAPVRMSLDGRALVGEAPARYVNALRRDPFFAGLTFAGLEIGEAVKPATATAPATTLAFRLVSQVDPAPDDKGAKP